MTSDPLAPFAQILRNIPDNVGDMRRVIELFSGFLNTGLPEVGAFHAAVPVADAVTADVIEPRGAGPHPVLVYLHGGGWVSGSPTTHRKLASRFAEAGILVFNVDYRLAPEHPFPAAFEDCLAAVRFAAREAGRWSGDGARLAVGGDSAGGNLSAAVAAALADDPARPGAALLLYGVFDFATLGDAPQKPVFGMDEATAARIRDKLLGLMVGAYLGPEPEQAAKLRDPRVSPLHAAERLPPCHVVVGGADPLVAQAEALVAALRVAGVEHEYFVDADMPHGYAQMEMLAPARPAIERMIAFLGKHLGS
jgi:acetyl esterase